MISIAIVEDDKIAADTLERYLNKYSQTLEDKFQITWYQDALAFLEGYRGVDLVFMDIQMPRLNGMDGALRLRKLDTQAVLIFVTNMAQYAVKGYEAEALDFIVKPLSYSDFSFKMKRAMTSIKMSRQKDIVIMLSMGMRRISSDELYYVEVRGHNLTYHLAEEELKVRGTMSNTEKQLSEWEFLRCNSCYLINPRHIEWVRGYTVKVGTDELQVSHPRKKKFLEELSLYYSKGGA
ncbi:MAG: putative two-component system response regulator [Herbinix sp.]|jgi:DNA-binding LytR/AlgR family response regulator|nr:putative two-component system response regulator [Herbinix sp.]